MNATTSYSPLAATQVLAARMAQALAAPTQAKGSIIRVEVPVEPLVPLTWLGQQRGFTQYYWRDRDGAFTMAGVGEAHVLMHHGEVESHTDLFREMRSRLVLEHPALRYYGGFRFRSGINAADSAKGTRWRQFKDYRFVVPRFEVLQRRRGCVLACNALCGEATANASELDSVIADLTRLRFRRDSDAPVTPRVIAREDHPNIEAWETLVAAALAAIEGGEMEKVVLARETCFTTEDKLNPVTLLARLSAASPNSYEFCFHPVADRAFIGASPERLFRRNNVHVESEALAGTRARGQSDEEDIELGEALLTSEKDRAEHEFVASMLRENLSQHCIEIEMPDAPRLKRLLHVQHLLTPIQGILKEVLDADATLLDALHPTPAVGGTPRNKALDFLETNEPFDRGIFAAPVGWVGFDGAEFCVAIRSGLVQGNTVAVYAGAGIVPGSEAAEEWAEIDAKMANFMDALSPVKTVFRHVD